MSMYYPAVTIVHHEPDPVATKPLTKFMLTLATNTERVLKLVEYIENIKAWFDEGELAHISFDYDIVPIQTEKYCITGTADIVCGNTIVDIKCRKTIPYMDICRQLHLYALGLEHERHTELDQYCLCAINLYDNMVHTFEVDVDVEARVLTNEVQPKRKVNRLATMQMPR